MDKSFSIILRKCLSRFNVSYRMRTSGVFPNSDSFFFPGGVVLIIEPVFRSYKPNTDLGLNYYWRGVKKQVDTARTDMNLYKIGWWGRPECHLQCSLVLPQKPWPANSYKSELMMDALLDRRGLKFDKERRDKGVRKRTIYTLERGPTFELVESRYSKPNGKRNVEFNWRGEVKKILRAICEARRLYRAD